MSFSETPLVSAFSRMNAAYTAFLKSAEAVKRELERAGCMPLSGDARVDRIIEAVAAHYKLTPEIIKGPTRFEPHAHARHVAVHMIITLTGATLQATGTALGGRDHGTAINSLNRIQDLLASNKDFTAELKAVRTACETALAQPAAA